MRMEVEGFMSYLRVSIKGTLPAGEVWSVNPVYGLIFAGTPSPTELNAAAQAAAAVEPGANLKAVLSNAASVDSIRVEARDTDFVLTGVGEASVSSPWTGSTAPNKTFGSSIVLSLRTAYPGASKRGRLYWPALNMALSSSTLRVTPAVAQAVCDEASEYLSDIGAALDSAFTSADVNLVVYSPTLHSSEYVDAIWVGDVLDVQRRRRDSVVESYVTAVHPAAP